MIVQAPSDFTSAPTPTAVAPQQQGFATPPSKLKPLEPLFSSESLVVENGLGSGGFGVVVEVSERQSGRADDCSRRRFAMKVLSKKKYSSAKNRLRLWRELGVLSLFPPSQWLLRCHHAFETRSHIFVVTDLLGGGNLYHHLEKQMVIHSRQGFPEGQVRTLLAEITLALFHFHSRGFMHRDLKLENVMLDSEGHVKLVDFGLALEIPTCVFELPTRPTGSLVYMAPELLYGRVGGRFTDWWALGILAFELFTGRSPFSTLADALQVREEIRTATIRLPLSKLVEEGELVSQLLIKNRRLRLGSMNDSEVRSSPFFAGVDWGAMERGETAPPLGHQHSLFSFPVDEGENARAGYERILVCEDEEEDVEATEAFNVGLELAPRAPRFADRDT